MVSIYPDMEATGVLQLVVYVVCQLTLDAHLLLRLVQRLGMLAVALAYGLLQLGIEPYDMVRDVVYLVARLRGAALDTLAPFGPLRKVPEALDLAAQTPRG